MYKLNAFLRITRKYSATVFTTEANNDDEESGIVLNYVNKISSKPLR